jgi:integral membrane protein
MPLLAGSGEGRPLQARSNGTEPRGTRLYRFAAMSVRNFRSVALLEATTFLLLLLASYLKHANDQPIGVTILGPIHGLLFIVYVVMALGLREDQGWSWRTTLLILLGAVVPFGGYVADRWLETNARVDTT